MTHRHTAARATILIAGVLAATMALAGCTPNEPVVTPTASETPTPTPTPTPAEVPAPASEEEAIAAATAAIGRYLALETQIFTDPSAPQDIEAVAEGQAAERLESFSSQMGELGGSGSGEIVFELQSAYTAPLDVAGQEIAFGQVNLKGCYDMSTLDLLNADGSPAEMPEVRRFVIDPTVIYRSATSSWVVVQYPIQTEIQEC